MPDSILQFTREFARLKSEIGMEPSADQKLMLLVNFQDKFIAHLSEPGFDAFRDEYSSLLEFLVTPMDLQDLLPEELESLLTATRQLNLAESSEAVLYQLASVYCWLGEAERAARIVADYHKTNLLPYDVELDFRGQTEFETLATLLDQIRDTAPTVASVLGHISADWASRLGELRHDRVNCLFVEKTQSERALRARMRVLEGTVEPFSSNTSGDEVAFDNQLKTPDDPFVGSVYQALQAVRKLASVSVSRHSNGRPYHAHYRVLKATYHFTGDSISLAAALVAYTQILRPTHSREERYLPLELAVTGGIDARGKLNAVNNDTIELKVRRAFFSRLRILVIPEGNDAEAHEALEKLRRQYPKRKLKIISAGTLEDTVNDLNVVRAEKVCIGEYVARSAYRYSRAAYVQVPFILILLYVLFRILYPMVIFDDNPAFVRVSGNGFSVFNADSARLWQDTFRCSTLEQTASEWLVFDLNEDGKNEVLFVPKAIESELSPDNARLFVYEPSGKLKFRREAAIIGQYPGDTSFNFPYIPQYISAVRCDEGSIIVSRVVASNPARLHVKFWNGDGDSLGWYIHSGYGGSFPHNLLAKNPDTLVSLCYNNRLKRCVLFALNPYDAKGVSPPYRSDDYDLSGVKHGSQFRYVVFPYSDVRGAIYGTYSDAYSLSLEVGGVIRAMVTEAQPDRAQLWYYLDHNFRVFRVIPDDAYISLRDSLVDQGLLPAISWDEYNQQLVDAVQYWTDSGWVSEGELRRLKGR